MLKESKKFISWLLVIAIIAGMIPPQVTVADVYQQTQEEGMGEPFEDVDINDWFYDGVLYTYNEGLFTGTGETTFSPNHQVTRGMFVTVLGRMDDVEPTKYQIHVFEDVARDSYYAPYINWAAKNNITKGINAHHFAPNDFVTREQLGVFIYNYLTYLDFQYTPEIYNEEKPKDYEQIAPWAQESVISLVRLGIIQGDEKGNFNPKKVATRAEAATLIKRIHQIIGADREVWEEEIPESTEDSNGSNSSDNNGNNSSNNNGNSSTNKEKASIYFVSNGGQEVAPQQIVLGESLNHLPVPRKENAIFLGWYEDASLLGEEFEEGAAITRDLTLYAKYIHIDSIVEENKDDTFTITAASPEFEIHITDVTGQMTVIQVKEALKLEAVDGSENVILDIVQQGSDFRISAKGGFLSGGSYKFELLSDGLVFEGQTNNIRKLTFTIDKEEVFNIALNEDIIYIPRDEVDYIVKNNQSVEEFSAPLIAIGYEVMVEETTGSFIYTGSTVLEAGDTLSVYSGEKPTAGDDQYYLEDDIAYLEVVKVEDTTIYYKDAEARNVLFVPEVLPISQEDITFDTLDQEVFTIPKNSIDFDIYEEYGLDETTTLDEEDYIVLFDGSHFEDAVEGSSIYGKIVELEESADHIKVVFEKMTLEAIEKELENYEFYSKNELDGDQILGDMDIAQIEREIEAQVYNSGFDEQLATQLAAYALGTSGVQELAGQNFDAQSMKFTLADNTEIDATQFQEIIKNGRNTNVEVGKPSVNAKISGNTQHFGRGVSADISIKLDITVHTTEKSAIVISVSANFTQEIKIDINTSAKTIWGKKWIFPYIKDYRVNANVDLYNYTGISFQVQALLQEVSAPDDSKPEEEEKKVDVTVEIENLLSSSDDEEIRSELNDLFSLYEEFSEGQTGWVELIRQNLFTSNYSLLYGIIQIRILADLVVSAELMVVVGVDFEYITAERYAFWVGVFSQTAGSDTIQLIDEEYKFRFYILGSLGIRAGIELEIFIGLFSVDLNSIGVGAQTGIYTRLSGFYLYEYWFRSGSATSRSEGAMHFELGAYLTIYFRAQVLSGKYEYKPTLYENEWPLLTAGVKEYVYDFAYEESKPINLLGEQVEVELADETFQMKSLDLRSGGQVEAIYDSSAFEITFDNDRFSVVNDVLQVEPPIDTDIAQAEMTIRWKTAPLTFSSVPLERTYDVIWSDLDDNGYSIIFDSLGGSIVSPISALYGELIEAPKNPEKVGYTFKGWYLDSGFNSPYTVPEKMEAKNTTVYAKWVENEETPYVVEHYIENIGNDDYTLAQRQILVGKTGSTVTPKEINYVGFTAPTLQEVQIEADGSTVVTYKYERKHYFVEYDLGYNDERIVEVYKYGARVSVPLVIRDGHRFLGWNGEAAIPETMPAENLKYEARWIVGQEKANYRVEYYHEDLEGENYTLYEEVLHTVDAGKEIDVFVKAYEGFTAPEAQTITLLPNETRVVKYYYSRNTYTINYEQHNIHSIAPESQSYKYGETIHLIETDKVLIEELFDQKYIGWTEDIVSGKLFVDETMPARNVTLHLLTEEFEKSSGYVIKVYEQDWEIQEKYNYLGYIYQQAPVGEHIIVDENSVPQLDRFKEWFDLVEPQEVVITEENKLQIVELYYKHKTYTITFDANGNEELVDQMPEPISLRVFEEVELPNISKEIPNVWGWQIEPTITGEYPYDQPFDFRLLYSGAYGEDKIGKDLILYPRIIELENKKVKVIHHQENIEDDEYTAYETTYYDVPSGMRQMEVPVGYYEGFESPKVQTVEIGEAQETIVNYYYTRKTYTIAYAKVNNYSSTPDSREYKYGQKIELTDINDAGIEDLFGQIYIGWTEDISSGKRFVDETMPAKDVILYPFSEGFEGATGYVLRVYEEDIDGQYIHMGYIYGHANVGDTITINTQTIPALEYMDYAHVLSEVKEISITKESEIQVVDVYYDLKTFTITFSSNHNQVPQEILPKPLTIKYGEHPSLPSISHEIPNFEGWIIDGTGSLGEPYDAPFEFELLYYGFYGTYEPGEDITLYPKLLSVEEESVPEVEDEEESVPEVEDEVGVESVPEVEDEVGVESVPEVEDEAEEESVPEIEDEVEAETVPEVEDEVEEESVPEIEDEVEEESVPEIEDEVEEESVPEVEDEVEAESVPEVEDETGAESVPEVEDEVEEESVPEVEDKVEAEPVPEVEDKVEAESVPEVEVGSEKMM